MRYNLKNLSKQEYKFFIKNIWNGVGSEYLPKPPPFIFKRASIRHDFLYWAGGCKKERKEADLIFLEECIRACNCKKYRFKIFKKIIYILIAFLYWISLRIIGGLSFEYCEEQCIEFNCIIKKWRRNEDNKQTQRIKRKCGKRSKRQNYPYRSRG